MRKHTSGFGLVELIAGSALLAMLGLAFSTMMRNNMKVERGVASNSEMTSIGTTVRMILARRESCAKSGLVNLTINPTSPSATPVTFHLPGAAGPGTVFLQEGQKIETTRKTESLRFTTLSPIGTGPAGENLFFATLTLETSVVGKATTTRDPKLNFNFILGVNAANSILYCEASGDSAVRHLSGYDEAPPNNAAHCTGTRYSDGTCGGGVFFKDIVFTQPFTSPPAVLVSPRAVCWGQGDCSQGATDKIVVYADAVTKNGFRMVCSGSVMSAACPGHGSARCRGKCDWIAVGR